MLFGLDKDYLYSSLEREIDRLGFVEAKKALLFAEKTHKGQYRAEGVPFIIHPMTVALHMLYMGITEEDMIVTALLHDVCEDCDIDALDLDFSDDVKLAVDRLTCKKEMGKNREQRKSAYFNKIKDNRIACMVKVFDRCNNISSMAKGFSETKIQRYIEETKKYVFPLIIHIENNWKEYYNTIYVVKYHMDSVICALERKSNKNAV